MYDNPSQLGACCILRSDEFDGLLLLIGRSDIERYIDEIFVPYSRGRGRRRFALFGGYKNVVDIQQFKRHDQSSVGRYDLALVTECQACGPVAYGSGDERCMEGKEDWKRSAFVSWQGENVV